MEITSCIYGQKGILDFVHKVGIYQIKNKYGTVWYSLTKI